MQTIHLISAKVKRIHDNFWIPIGYLETSEEAEEIKAKLESANPDSEFTINSYAVKGEYARTECGPDVWLARKFGKHRAAYAYANHDDQFIEESECYFVDPLYVEPLYPFDKDFWQKNNWKKGKWANF